MPENGTENGEDAFEGAMAPGRTESFRLPNAIKEMLDKASMAHTIPQTEIARMALRKARTLPEPPAPCPESGGDAYKIFIFDSFGKIDDKEMRDSLWWYLDSQRSETEKALLEAIEKAKSQEECDGKKAGRTAVKLINYENAAYMANRYGALRKARESLAEEIREKRTATVEENGYGDMLRAAQRVAQEETCLSAFGKSYKIATKAERDQINGHSFKGFIAILDGDEEDLATPQEAARSLMTPHTMEVIRAIIYKNAKAGLQEKHGPPPENVIAIYIVPHEKN